MKAYVIVTKPLFTKGIRHLYVAGSYSCTDDLQEATLFTTEESAGDEAFRQSSMPRIGGRQTFWPIRVEVTIKGVVEND